MTDPVLTPEALDTIEAEKELARLRKVYFPWSPEDSQKACDLIKAQQVELRRLRTENERLRSSLSGAPTPSHRKALAERDALQAKIDAALAVPEWSFHGDTAALIRAALTGEATE